MTFEEAMAEIEKLKWRQTTIRADLSREKKLRKAFHDEIVRLEAERTKLIEALRFYADKTTYRDEESDRLIKEGGFFPYGIDITPIADDLGGVARAALANLQTSSLSAMKVRTEKAEAEAEHLRGIAEERYRKLATAQERITALEEGLRTMDDTLFWAQKLFLGPSDMLYEEIGVRIAQARTKARQLLEEGEKGEGG